MTPIVSAAALPALASLGETGEAKSICGHRAGHMGADVRIATNQDSQEFRVRLGSALVLASVALVALWMGVLPFAILVTAFAILMSWEWGRAVRGDGNDLSLLVQISAIVLAALLLLVVGPATGLIVLAAAAAVVLALNYGSIGIMSAAGVLYVGLPALALIWLRQDPQYGVAAVLFIFVVVWSHDTFAMLCGKSIGGPKLWPSLSPHKTWSGAAGGLLASSAAASLFALAMPGADPVYMAINGLVIGMAGLAGDLIESSFKRAHGLKNASELIPGHGGVLDRLDGIVVAAVMAAVIGLSINGDDPARALIFWN